MSKPIQTAVVGVGLSSQAFHVPLLLALPNDFNLHTVVERSPPADAPGGTLGVKFGISVKVVNAFEDVLADPEIELIVLGTPNTTHYPLAKAALEAGKHVLVDKPIAPTYAECQDLLQIAKKANRVLYAFQNRRWDSDFLTIRKLVDSGRLGELIDFVGLFDRYRPKLRGYWREDPAPGAGITFDLGPHVIDQALLLFGRPTKVTGFLYNVRNLGHEDVDDSFSIHLHYPPTAERPLAPIVCVRSHPLSVRSPGLRFTLRGTLGSFNKFGFDVQEDQIKSGLTYNSAELGVESADHQGTLQTLNGDKVETEKVPTERGTYTELYKNLAAVIRDGASPAVKWEEASTVIQILELAHQSSKEGRTVDLPPV